MAFPGAGREGQRQKVTRASEDGRRCSGTAAVEHRVRERFCHLSFRKGLFYFGFRQRCTHIMSVTKS